MTPNTPNPAPGGRGARVTDLLASAIGPECNDTTHDLQDERIGYDQLKEMSVVLRRPVGTLVALSPGNDPFYAGSPARQKAAEWFANLWGRFLLRPGVHLRRIHYVLVSQASPVVMANGKPYENTEECWRSLINASKYARDLDLVSARAFVDRRNDEPLICLPDYGDGAPFIGLSDRFASERLTLAMPELPKLWLSRPTIPQRYHVEIWCEKTTVNDVLAPLARRYGLNVITGAGELSKTACVNAVDRARASGRPMRILYVSDFDPGGESMPVAVARKIEHRLHYEGLDLDVQVRPVALTAEQVVAYKLPRIPIKDSERRAASFEGRHGEGAVELDALEALHPGLLRRILVREIERYHDESLDRRVGSVASQIEATLDEITASVHAAHHDRVAELKTELGALNSLISEWEERAKPLWQAIANSLDEAAPDLDEIRWPEPIDGDEDPDPLFSSRRPYVDQIDRYKRHQGKPTARKPRQARD